MVAKKAAVKKEVGKLALKKETIQDLDARRKSGKIRGGRNKAATDVCMSEPPPCIRISDIVCIGRGSSGPNRALGREVGTGSTASAHEALQRKHDQTATEPSGSRQKEKMSPMVTKKASAGKTGQKKLSRLKIRKDTVRDLETSRGGDRIKGGAASGAMCLRMTGTTCMRMKKDTL